MKKTNVFCYWLLLLTCLLFFSEKTIAQCTIAPVNLGNDTSLCTGQTINLNAGLGYRSYLWSDGSTGVTLNNIGAGTHSVTVTELGAETVVNRDFENGNAGFTSDYVNDCVPNVQQGGYCIGDDPFVLNTAFTACTDHTSGAGDMMIIDAATTANVSIWCQDVPVTANTDYEFSAWLTRIFAPNPARLQFSINGTLLGSPFTLSSGVCTWDQFFETWNSGTSTVAKICIVNQNTVGNGNDLAIDDISFKPICTFTDEIIITEGTARGVDSVVSCTNFIWIDNNIYTSSNSIATHMLVGGATNGCDSIVTLNLTISSAATGIDSLVTCADYLWIDGINYTTSNSTATHTIVGGTSNGCDSTVTLNLTILGSKSAIDEQTACGSYTWIDGNVYTTSNDMATQTIVGGASNGCDSIVTLNLTINQVGIGVDTKEACNSYLWSDGQNYTESNTTATDTIFGGAFNGCDSVITLNLTIKLELEISLGDDVFFCEDSILLSPGDGYISYSWSNGSSDSSLLVTTEGSYGVTVEDSEGCSGYDEVQVVDNCPFSLYAPNAFTPDEDNKNEVFRVFTDKVVSLDVIIFNRWGEEIYTWKTIDGFWEGRTTSGEMVQDGIYPYLIKYSYYNVRGQLAKGVRSGHVTLLR